MKTITISMLYNWICNDPIIDLLERKYSFRKQPKPSEDYYLQPLVPKPSKPIQLSVQSFVAWLKQQCPLIDIKEDTAHVYHHLKKQIDGISQPPFRSASYMGSADLILHNNVMKQLGFEDEKEMYSIIFMNKGLPLSTYLMYKAILAKISFENMMDQKVSVYGCTYDYPRKTYIILKCDTESWMDSFYEGLDWLRDLEEHIDEWSIDSPTPPDHRLLPNLGNHVDEWDEVKTEVAKRWKEMTLLCHIGNITRGQIRAKGIYTFDDPRFDTYLRTHNIPPITGLIANSLLTSKKNTSASVLVPSLNGVGVLRFNRTVISVDIESFAGRWYDGTAAGDTFIGCLVFDNDNQSVAKHVFFDKSSQIVKTKFERFLREYYPTALLIHYSEADLSVIPRGFETLDVLPLVRKQYMTDPLFREYKMYKFGLKHVTGLMFGDLYAKCKIKNGCEASAALYHSVRYGLESERGRELFSQVEEYNEVDLYALAYLYRWLLNHEISERDQPKETLRSEQMK